MACNPRSTPVSKTIGDVEGGKVPETFSASISQVRPEWGFVVIGAGHRQRVAEGAVLAVRRGGAEVAQVKVTEVFQDRAIADVLPSSVADGVTVRAGDRVYATSE